MIFLRGNIFVPYLVLSFQVKPKSEVLGSKLVKFSYIPNFQSFFENLVRTSLMHRDVFVSHWDEKVKLCYFFKHTNCFYDNLKACKNSIRKYLRLMILRNKIAKIEFFISEIEIFIHRVGVCRLFNCH